MADTTNTGAAKTYEQPDGIFPGNPPIAYPNTPGFKPAQYVPVGGVILAADPIEYNSDRRTVKIKVRNTGYEWKTINQSPFILEVVKKQ